MRYVVELTLKLNKMTEQLISFDTALLAKEKGFLPNSARFPYKMKNMYGRCDYDSITGKNCMNINNKNVAFAPSQGILQKWFREKHYVHILISVKRVYEKNLTKKIKYRFNFYNLNTIEYIPDSFNRIKYYNTYESALEEGLQEALKLI